MTHLWRQCTLEQTHVLPAFVVRKYLGPGGVDAIVRARLGVAIDGDRVRIRGTKGRIEWLQKLRENGKKGGRPPRVRAKPSGYQVGKPSGSPELNPPAPAPAPAPAPISEREARPKARKSKVQVPADWRPSEPIEFRWENELERFRNHHRAKGNTFANIDLAWRNWQSRSDEWNGNKTQTAIRQLDHIG
jgi:hypothetical protein